MKTRLKSLLRIQTPAKTMAHTIDQIKANKHEKSAKLALTIGKMYEEMGLVQKSITLFDEALAVWECDPARQTKEKIGGFTMDEINSFSNTDLEYIIQLLIAKGRVNGTFNSAVDTGQKNAAQAWLDALEIYERAPARAEMKDRSIIFPIFSGLFVFLKGGKIQQDKECNFEQNLVRKFVRETNLHGDPVHYTRALAMQCEVKARLGKYKSALESFDKLQAIYDAEEHSEGISAAYGTDRSAQAFSQCALWYLQMGDAKAALEKCNYVLDNLLPLMDPKNVLNMCELLLPIIRIYKPLKEERRMRDLFDRHVVQNFNKHFGKDGVTPCLPIFKPLTMLLDICHDPTSFRDDVLVDAVEWLVDGENGVAPDFLDSVYTKLCWSPNDMVAELCLLVAKRLIDENGDFGDVRTLLQKGLRLVRKADRKIKNDKGEIILPISYEMHEPVYREIMELAEDIGGLLSPEDDHDMNGSTGRPPSTGGNSQMADPSKNLPASYLKAQTSDSGSREGSGSATSSHRNSLQPSRIIHYESATSTNSSVGASTSGCNNSKGNFTSRLSDLSLTRLDEEEDDEELGQGIPGAEIRTTAEPVGSPERNESALDTTETTLDEDLERGIEF